MKKLSLLSIATAVVAGSAATAQAATIVLDNLELRTAGPLVTNVAATDGSFGPTAHGLVLWTENLTVTSQDLDGDGNLDDSFTFDLNATSTNSTGISNWNQGISNSNGMGTGNSFTDVDGITFSVSNVVGTTTGGKPIMFDGFTAGGLGAFIFDGTAVNQGGLINGIQVDAAFPAGEIGGVAEADLSGTLPATVRFNNSAPSSGSPNGTRIARSLDLQFSAIPEPTSLALFGLGVVGLVGRRRR